MMYTIHVGDAVLAEFDLQALYQRETTPLQVGTLSSCPACGVQPDVRKDDGRWYLVGATRGCPACDRVWALPDEDELADMQARETAQKHTPS